MNGIGADPQARPGRPALSIVIPAWNEGENLSRLLPLLKEAVATLGVDTEILVVDARSEDGTAAICREQGARYLAVERGYGRALTAGFGAATGEFLLQMDADFSHPAAFVRTLWEHRADADLLIASRYAAGGRAEMSRLRRILSRILNLVFRTVLHLPLRDLSSGFRLFRRTLLPEMHPEGRDFDFLPEMVVLAVARGFRVREVPFAYSPRVTGSSHARFFAFALQYGRTLGRMWLLRNSIRSADYDRRAYDSLIPLQRWWQRRRCRIISGWTAGRGPALDVGCGSSRILESLAAGSVGLDPEIAKLRVARRSGQAVVAGALPGLPVKNGAFSTVVCSQVLEHIPADPGIFAEFSRVLAPQGELILGTPDYGRRRWRIVEALYRRLIPGGYADEHITHYDRRTLRARLAAAGFATLEEAYVGGGELILRCRKAGEGPG